ncbi:unnamed protein product [Darwinula stevensoni]|uniref:dolichyl-phosphate-mannose--protein mannosyltransferase n=1 Tax=Darwinula stevensoni TaxID=69355 RepID=A0A7R8WZ63_9CRUS|nr:unnamed protein product [Darwinula stevensoni]CAG0879705.1 unnamed protein product [Darwinula stevensoni]
MEWGRTKASAQSVTDGHISSTRYSNRLGMCSMFLPELSALVAALLFALHPVHTEAVTGVVGRAELLSSICFLSAFEAYSRSARPKSSTNWGPLMVTVMLVTGAMLCKEQGITIVGMHLRDVVELGPRFLEGKGEKGGLYAPFLRISTLIATSVCLLLARVLVMGAQLPVFTRFDNPAAGSETPVRQLTYNYLLSVNAKLLLAPADLCCDWTMGTVPLVESLADPRNLETLTFYLTLGALVRVALTSPSTAHREVVCMALALMAFPFLPASNLFFPVGFVVAERVLYMPSMGFCLLVAFGWQLLSTRRGWRKGMWLGLGFLLVVHAGKTWVRSMDWETESSIFLSGLKVNHRNAKLYNNVGHAFETQGHFQDALKFFQQAVRVQPDDIGAHINVGRTYNNLKMFDESEAAYLRAKSLLPKARPGESYQARIAPNHLSVFLNLANLIARNSSRLAEADRLYRQAIAMRADYTQAYINRGDILIKMNRNHDFLLALRTREAQEVYERALFYDSKNPDIYYNLGVVFLEQGKALQALAYLDKALEFEPEHGQALLNSAVLIQEYGLTDLRPLAIQRLNTLLYREPHNERVHFNLGMFAMDERDFAAAEAHFKLAVGQKEDFRSALFNLALLLAEAKRPLEAVPFLNQLLKFHPDHVKGLILLGDIYINNMKDLDAAEKCYERILSVEPENVQAQHNLCVVYVERGELGKAETCFATAHRLAPHEDYIHRHWGIVRTRIQQQQQQQQHQHQQQQQPQHRPPEPSCEGDGASCPPAL